MNLCLSFHDNMGDVFCLKKPTNLGSESTVDTFSHFSRLIIQPTNFSRNKQQNRGLFTSGKDILLYRGELARCADLLAFQLGKELLCLGKILLGSNFFGGRPQNPRGKTKFLGQTSYIYLGQNPK